MNWMTRLSKGLGILGCVLILMLLFSVTTTQAQVVGVDTITVTFVGDLPESGVQIDSLLYADWRLNDTLPLVATWLDSEGDPVPGGVFTWGTDRPDLLTIWQDAALNWFAVPTGKGTGKLFVRIEAGDVMHVAFLNPDRSLDWVGGEIEAFEWVPSLGDSTLYEGAWVYDYRLQLKPEAERQAQFCGYLVTAQNALVAESPGPPTCPMAFLPLSTTLDRVFANTTRSISWDRLWRLGTSLRGAES